MAMPPLNRTVFRLVRDEINWVLQANGLSKLKQLDDSVTFAVKPGSRKQVTWTLAQLVVRKLGKPEVARRIVAEARKRIGARA